MTEHRHQLYAAEFTAADQARLAGFSCGDATWARHVAEWIRGSDVLDSIRRGTKVWLFETAEREIVGFGSLGLTRWRWPPPDGTPAKVLLIPMLGLSLPRRRVRRSSGWCYWSTATTGGPSGSTRGADSS